MPRALRRRDGRPRARAPRAPRWAGAGSPGAGPVGPSPHANGGCRGSGAASGRGPAWPGYALAPMTSPAELQAQADALALVPQHRPGPRRRHQGQQRAGDLGRRHPRRQRAQRARHRRLGREVLLPGRAGRGRPGGGPRPLRLGRRLRRPRGLLGGVHPERHAARPVARRDRLLAARTSRAAVASSSPPPRSGRRSSRSWPTSRPSTSTSSGRSTSCSTSACSTTCPSRSTCLERVRAVTKEVAVIETEAVHLQGLDHEALLQFYAGSSLHTDFGNWYVPDHRGPAQHVPGGRVLRGAHRRRPARPAARAARRGSASASARRIGDIPVPPPRRRAPTTGPSSTPSPEPARPARRRLRLSAATVRGPQ